MAGFLLSAPGLSDAAFLHCSLCPLQLEARRHATFNTLGRLLATGEDGAAVNAVLELGELTAELQRRQRGQQGAARAAGVTGGAAAAGTPAVPISSGQWRSEGQLGVGGGGGGDSSSSSSFDWEQEEERGPAFWAELDAALASVEQQQQQQQQQQD